jgi:hypothetical protein
MGDLTNDRPRLKCTRAVSEMQEHAYDGLGKASSGTLNTGTEEVRGGLLAF